MSVKIEELINKEKNKVGHVCAMGPSIKNKLVDLNSLDRDKNVIISCNDVDVMTDLTPDYWVLANQDYKISKLYERFNKFKNVTLFYADSCDSTDRELVKNLLNINFYGYDQRHFNSRKLDSSHKYADNLNMCNPNKNGSSYRERCCENIIENRLTIQELLKKISNSDEHYGTGDSVAIHMVALGVILGCNPINIYGVDLDYRLGYVDGKTINPNLSEYDMWMNNIKRDLSIIRDSSKLLNIEINYFGFNKEIENIFSRN